MRDPGRVVFISGAARSGSTLLGEMLGAQPGVLNAGELSLFWRELHRGGHCACGCALSSCPVWGPAVDRVRHELDLSPADVELLARTRAGLARTSRPLRLLTLLRDPTRVGWSPEERMLVEATTALHEAALRQSGSSIVVDTSKTLSALLFTRLLGVRPAVVHLVRDPRAVAASTLSSRGVHRGNIEGLPPGGGLITAVARWTAMNTVAGLASPSLASTAVRVHYEDLVAEPAPWLEGLCRAVGVPFSSSTIADRGLVLAEASHAAVGNPRRGGAAGTTKVISEDVRWRRELNGAQAALVRAATAPAATWLRGSRGV